MIFNKKVLYATLFVLSGLMFNPMQASDVRDEQDRTELINFVIDAEDQIADKLKVYQDWCDRCYHGAGSSRKELSSGCTDEDIYALLLSKKDLAGCIDDAKNRIKDLVDAGAIINEKDFAGKTVINYVKTRALYNELRSLGANYQLGADLYFYGGSYLLKTIFVAAFVGLACQLAQHINISSQEQQGIAQEALSAFLAKTGGKTPEQIKALYTEWYGNKSDESAK